MPVFIVFEGPDGSGKSTALRAVAEYLETKGIPVTCTAEPSQGDVGSAIREWLRNPAEVQLSDVERLDWFYADRREHLQTVIDPALNAGRVVLCDRYTASTVAYQGTDTTIFQRAVSMADTVRPANMTLVFMPTGDAQCVITNGSGVEAFDDPDVQDQVTARYHDLYPGDRGTSLLAPYVRLEARSDDSIAVAKHIAFTLASMFRQGNVIDHETGKTLNPLNPAPSYFNLKDVCYNLAKVIRFGRQSSADYTVAQHSYNVMLYEFGQGTTDPIALLACALHDGEESVLGDPLYPVTVLTDVYGQLGATKARIRRAIMESLGLGRFPEHLHKRADKALLYAELDVFIGLKLDVYPPDSTAYANLEPQEPAVAAYNLYRTCLRLIRAAADDRQVTVSDLILV